MTRTVQERAGDHDRTPAELLALLSDVLRYARERGYAGWDYADGMSSRIRRWLPVENKWVNLAFQETAKRAPVNVRPLLLVERRRNVKGAGLFAMANLGMARHVETLAGDPGGGSAVDTADGSHVDTAVDYRAEARSLCDWLLLARSRGYAGFCGGPRHAIQGLAGRGEPGDPDLVTTAYAARGLLAAGALDPVYPAVARTAADFAREDLGYDERDGGLEVTYFENHPEDSYTINAGAVWARLLLDLHAQFGAVGARAVGSGGDSRDDGGSGDDARNDDGNDRYLERATGLLDRIADLQTDAGGWYYREPPDASHLSMDNHHNGFVIEAFQRYRAVTGDDRYDDTHDAALSFYREVLFEDDGAPNFDEESAYPRDIHASTQGVLVFTAAGDLGFAERIISWTIDNLHAGGGRFYFRKHRFHTKRHVLMRWCQAWMAYALSEYLAAVLDSGSSTAGSGARFGAGSGEPDGEQAVEQSRERRRQLPGKLPYL